MDVFDRILDYLLWFLRAFACVCLIWIGAEYVFEGTVHSSTVDTGVGLALAYLMTERWFERHGEGE